MTNSNVTTKTDKAILMEMIGKPIFINHFNQPEGYFPIPAGHYFIDAVIFHYSGNIEIGVSEYKPEIPIEQFNIDESHISYFHLDDLVIPYPYLVEAQGVPLDNQKILRN